MREAFDKLFGGIAKAVDIHSKFEWWIKLLAFVVVLWPTSGFLWQKIELLDPLLSSAPWSLEISHLLVKIVSYIIFFFMGCKGLDLYIPQGKTLAAPAQSNPASARGGAALPAATGEIISEFTFKPETIRFKKNDDPYVQIGDMIFTEKDLYTSVLITGVTGTGKTSAAVFPMLEQIFSIYNEQGPGDLGNIGGLCLDVKGEFFEGIIYYMHHSGRNVFEDLQVIRPNCLMPVVKMRDPKTGFVYFLNAKSCSSGAEAWDLVRGKQFKDGSDIPLNVFTFPKNKLRSYEERLKEVVFDVADSKPRYLGWRYQGDKMVRVSHTPAFNQTQCKLDSKGRRIVVDAPRNLIYENVIFVDNDLRYNIVEPDKPAPEAAMRLNLISTLAEGEKQSGENAYWYKRARSHIGSCIELWRLAYGDDPQCTAQAIYKITQQDDYAKKQVRIVEQKIKEMQDEADAIEDFADKVGLEREIDRMTSIVKYFTEEWGKYDSKTKTIIGSVVANAFDTFNKDPILQDSFCQPKTFSFEQCIQEGKVFVLVPGDEYETVAKILGTALKMDFQSVILSRMHRSELNQNRKIMLVNDECQKFVVAGGSQGAGDEHFMSLCRQSKCFNINATQADSWIISVVGRENSDVYLQNYNGRIWFRTNDKETAEKGEVLCGIKKQKTRSAGGGKAIHIENLLMGPKGSADHTPSFTEKEEEKPRFAKDKFYNLEMWECITFNGTRTGSDKACQSQCEPAVIGSPDGQKEVRNVMRIYFQGYLENVIFKQNGGKTFDHIEEKKAQKIDDQPKALLLEEESPKKTTESVKEQLSPKEEPKAQAHSNTVPEPQKEAPAAASVSAPTTKVSAPKKKTKKQAEAPLILLKPDQMPKAAPIDSFKNFGPAEKLQKKIKKLTKAIELEGPRFIRPAEGTLPPFQAPQQEAEKPKPEPTPSKQKPSIKEITDENNLPLVDADHDPMELTPQQLKTLADDYKNNPETAINDALSTMTKGQSINPSEYLPSKQEEELNNSDNRPALAAERAALGPKGKQGGNPNLALKNGGTIEVPATAEDVYARARKKALEHENIANKKAIYNSVSSTKGPSVDEQTLDILRTLKPEEDDS